jgi:DALR anticodon binding domain
MTMARLALVQGVVTVLASGLGLLGVEAPDEMRSPARREGRSTDQREISRVRCQYRKRDEYGGRQRATILSLQ